MNTEPRRLPVINTVIAAYWTAWNRRAALWPLAPLLLIGALLTAWATQAARPESGLEHGAGGMLLQNLLSVAVSVLVAVRCHRLFLLDEPPNDGRWTPHWNTNDWRFLWRTVQISVLLLVIALPPAAILAYGLAAERGGDGSPVAALGLLLLGLALLPVSVRLSLALPAAATGTDGGLREAWRIGVGNSWRLVAVFLGFVLPVLGIDLAIEWLTRGWLASALVGTVSIAATVVGIAVLSVSYRALRPPSEVAGDTFDP